VPCCCAFVRAASCRCDEAARADRSKRAPALRLRQPDAARQRNARLKSNTARHTQRRPPPTVATSEERTTHRQRRRARCPRPTNQSVRTRTNSKRVARETSAWRWEALRRGSQRSGIAHRAARNSTTKTAAAQETIDAAPVDAHVGAKDGAREMDEEKRKVQKVRRVRRRDTLSFTQRAGQARRLRVALKKQQARAGRRTLSESSRRHCKLEVNAQLQAQQQRRARSEQDRQLAPPHVRPVKRCRGALVLPPPLAVPSDCIRYSSERRQTGEAQAKTPQRAAKNSRAALVRLRGKARLVAA